MLETGRQKGDGNILFLITLLNQTHKIQCNSIVTRVALRGEQEALGL